MKLAFKVAIIVYCIGYVGYKVNSLELDYFNL